MDFNQKGLIMNYQPYCDHKNVEGILYSAAGFLVIHEHHPFMEREKNLLYKHQRNTKRAFARKLDIFTCENNMLSSHAKISPLLWLHNKLF